ncbi:DUF4178 domain-containing protein [Sphingomicrobium arenosum]|uniref:DUF4178 domain-containing protein n=1 Tax=Sphingomicrobium arenosum TaxID=2233861 RepID=UPI00223F3AB5|nr:DUF4178 domain-containing protein [Sphingomicrobium arenosum]
MDALNCPQCGAGVEGALPGLPVVTCASCDSMLMIERGGIEKVGDSGHMPFDVSPLQLGTSLMIEGTRGVLVGRERWAWTRGSWNEWLCELPGGRHAWVAEETGLYMMMSPIEPEPAVMESIDALSRRGRAALGKQIKLRDQYFTVADVKTIRCIASEGHLPHVVPARFERVSLDCRHKLGVALTYQRDANGAGLWMGDYRRLDELAPRGLRRFDDWAAPRFEGVA